MPRGELTPEHVNATIQRAVQFRTNIHTLCGSNNPAERAAHYSSLINVPSDLLKDFIITNSNTADAVPNEIKSICGLHQHFSNFQVASNGEGQRKKFLLSNTLWFLYGEQYRKKAILQSQPELSRFINDKYQPSLLNMSSCASLTRDGFDLCLGAIPGTTLQPWDPTTGSTGEKHLTSFSHNNRVLVPYILRIMLGYFFFSLAHKKLSCLIVTWYPAY